MARDLKKELPWVEVELVLFDPVPGPGHKGSNVELDLSEVGLSEFTLIYSIASGYKNFFDPQMVFGAKRIIISTQGHSAGKSAGFRYNKQVYRGSNLNSLEPGVYIDLNREKENKKELVKVDDIKSAYAKFEFAIAARTATHLDAGERHEIIIGVLNDYFANAPASQGAQG